MAKAKKIIVPIVVVAVIAAFALLCWVGFNLPTEDEQYVVNQLEEKYGAEGVFKAKSLGRGNEHLYDVRYKKDGVKVDFRAGTYVIKETDEDYIDDNFADMYIKTQYKDALGEYEASLVELFKKNASDKVCDVEYNYFKVFRGYVNVKSEIPTEEDIAKNLGNLKVVLDVDVPEFKDKNEAGSFVLNMKDDIVSVLKFADAEFKENFENRYEEYDYTPYTGTRVYIGKNPQIEVVLSDDTIHGYVRTLDDEGNEKECLNAFTFPAEMLFGE